MRFSQQVYWSACHSLLQCITFCQNFLLCPIRLGWSCLAWLMTSLSYASLLHHGKAVILEGYKDRWEKHQQPQVCGWYHSNESEEELKVSWWEWRRRLQTKYLKKKVRSWHPPPTVWQIEGGKVEIVTDFFFLAPKSLRMLIEMNMKSEDDCFLAGKQWQT